MSETTIVIPMAGSGQRFRDAGFALPKPLIDVRGQPMITHVIDNIRLGTSRIILIARKSDAEEHAEEFEKIRSRYSAELVLIDKLTEGAACTVLHALPSINNDTPLLIANSDQWMDFSAQDFVNDAGAKGWDGSILTFAESAADPKWSYAKTGADGLVTQTREKAAISTHATAGVYWFARGRLFVEAAEEMIARNDRCNNEFYVCPVYNYLIRRKMRIGIYEIEAACMHGLGTPEDLQIFLKRGSV